MTWKLSPRAFERFWDVHAWAGVITSLVVYVMFLLGSVVLFFRPLSVWEEPLLQRSAPVLASLQAPLDLVESLPDEFYYYLPVDGRGLPKIAYYLPGTTKWRMWWIDPSAGRVIPQREMMASYMYDLHYLWHDVTGYWLQYGAGFLVFGFLLAIVTGVLIHLRQLVPQLHRFRPRRTMRVLWSDMHKVTGVLGLPFQLVYALTGTLMALSPLLFGLSVGPVFGGDAGRAVDTAGALIDDPPARDRGGPAAPLPLDAIVARARAAEPRLEAKSFVFRGYGLAGGTVDVRGHVHGEPFGDGLVRVKAVDGSVERIETPDRTQAVGTLARWIHGLHTVEYGGLTVRILLFILALAGCATILTGNWVWLERRDARRQSLGNTILARLTAGAGAGAIVAVAALFLSSRLLPLEWSWRTGAEELVLASVFAASIGLSLACRRPAALWWRLVGCAGLLMAAVPLAAMRYSTAGLAGDGPLDPTVAGVEVGFLLVAGALLASAAWIRSATRRRVVAGAIS